MSDEPFRRLFTPRAVLAGFSLCLVLALGVAAVTSAVPFGAYNSGWDGTSTVRDTIDTDASQPPVIVETTGYARFDGAGTLVVIFAPEESYSPADTARLRRFLARGGTIMIAEDRRTDTNQLLERLGASTRIDGRSLRDPQTFYRDPSLPVVTDLNNTSITRNVESITLNGATVLQPGNATTIARTSEFAYLDRNRNEELDAAERLRSYPVATSEQVGNGQVFVLSDPSVFINRMVEREGNLQLVTQSAQSYDRVVLDFSHRPGTPPVAVLWLWLRRTAWAQAAFGFAGTGVALVSASVRVRTRLRSVIASVVGSGTSSGGTVGLTPGEMRELLQQQHPEWDGERIERIAESMNHVTEDGVSETDE